MRGALLALVVASAWPGTLAAQDSTEVRLVADSVTVRFVNTDVRAAVRALTRYMDKPVVMGNLPENRIQFFETPEPVATTGLPNLLRAIVETQGLAFEEDSAFYRIVPVSPRAAAARAAGQPGQVEQPPPDTVRFHVLRLKHAIAGDVAATVNQLYGSGSFGGTSGLSSGTLSDDLRRNLLPIDPQSGAPAGPAGEPSSTALAGPVIIVPDERTNSLLVRATDGDFAVLAEAIEQMDVRPLQVLIEILIVEARKDRSFAAGLELTVPPQDVAGGTIEGGFGTAGLGNLVVSVMSLGKFEIDGLLTAARRRGDVKILSRPVLLASNNTEARLLVGAQRPFVQVSRSLPTDTPSRDQVVQYRDVGTKLTVRPTINEDGYVLLMIQQEISAATEETQFEAPVISTREAVTQVLVRDEQTVVLGGLTDRQRDQVRTGVPLLADLPILGGLFGSTTTRTIETELFLFITPRIIRNDDDAQRVTDAGMAGKVRREMEKTEGKARN